MNNIVVLVTAIIQNSEGKILFLQRSDEPKTFKGHWQLPEGKKEFGEPPEAALTREILEETQMKTTELKLWNSFSATISDGENQYDLLRIVYQAKTTGEIKLESTHHQYAWFSIKEAKGLEKKISGLSEILGVL